MVNYSGFLLYVLVKYRCCNITYKIEGMIVMGLLRKLFGPSLNSLAKEEIAKKKKEKSNSLTPSTSNISKKNDDIYIFSFRVAGVTYKTGNKSRQAMLKKIKNEKEPFKSIDFVEFIPYKYENEDAYYVSINDEIIGNIPKKLIPKYKKYESHRVLSTYVDIIGGPNEFDDDDSYYGCEIDVTFDLNN